MIIPPTATDDARRVLIARSLRAFSDGFIAIVLPLHLFAVSYTATTVGIIATVAMLGSAVLTLVVGVWAHAMSRRFLMQLSACIMCLTGLGFAFGQNVWLLLAIAFFGTLNPSSGDVSVFVPLEHTALSHSISPGDRTALFARYSFVGSVAAALGSSAAGLVDWLGENRDHLSIIQGMFLIYAASGAITWTLYRRLSPAVEGTEIEASPLGPSRTRVCQLAALFSLDSFGGGFVLNTLIAVWLFQRFGLSATEAGGVFFATGLCSACSQLVAAHVARRIGLINTMVFTHLPANLFLATAAFAPTLPIALILLVLRSLLSQMDVPARTSYVMAVVQPAERPAAASFTAVPRSLTAALSPAIAGWLLSASPFGWPLVIAGTTKIAYDLCLWRFFSKVKPPEEH
ncbi:MAG: MFS transporter [Burkholderiales bacterium]